MTGKKYDADKLRYDLLEPRVLREEVAALTRGARKYSPRNWQKVVRDPDGPNRYLAAAFRHIEAFRMGESLDPETEIHHLAHARACLMFVLWADLEGRD